MKNLWSAGVILIFSICVISCGDASFDEVARTTSPDGIVDAVLVETNGGATTSFGYRVFIVDKGGKVSKDIEEMAVARLYGAGRNQQAYGANLRWYSVTELTVEYLDAKKATLLKDVVKVGDKEILINFKSGINDSTAPPGGMLYNIKKLDSPGSNP